MTNPLFNLGKSAAGILISLGVGAVVQNAVNATTPFDQKLLKKISVKVGGYVLSSMVADHAVKYSFEQIDATKAWFEEVHTAFKQPKDVVTGEVIDEDATN